MRTQYDSKHDVKTATRKQQHDDTEANRTTTINVSINIIYFWIDFIYFQLCYFFILLLFLKLSCLPIDFLRRRFRHFTLRSSFFVLSSIETKQLHKIFLILHFLPTWFITSQILKIVGCFRFCINPGFLLSPKFSL